MAHVLIVGAGIGGLTAALCLHARGIRVTVAEAAPKLRSLGVGINLLPHGTAVLHDLGLKPALAATGIETRALEYRTEYGQVLLSDPRGHAAGLPYPQYSIHRGALQMLLYDAACARLPPGTIRTGLRLLDFQQDTHVTGIFVDRVGHECRIAADALVGADGNRSQVCAKLHPDTPSLLWNGITMWRGAIETDRFLDGRTMVVAGHHERKAVLYPISREADCRGRSLLNWVAELQTDPATLLQHAGDWTRAASAEVPAAAFAGMCDGLIDLSALFRATEQVAVYPMVDRDPLPHWTAGRVTLLGDAAHPMWPIGSNGASQAILDAEALADAVAAGAIPQALAAYERIRRPATAAVVASNRAKGPEAILTLAHERLRGPDDDAHARISATDIERIVAGYRHVAGFDAASLGARAARVAA